MPGSFVDTNVLAYAEGLNDGTRRDEAVALLEALAPETTFLPVQTLGELFNVLVHKAGSDSIRNYPKLAIPPLPELIASYEAIAAPVRPARVAALALNTSTLDEAEARAAVAAAEEETGLTADDVVRFGAERVLDAVLERLP